MDHSNFEKWLNTQVQTVMLPNSPLPTPPRKRFRFRHPRSDYVEDPRLYRAGGHHPVNIGDMIQERYQILHKLGHGGFGLVWLARDLAHHQYVALKILRGDAPERELMMLGYLRDTFPSIPMAHLRDTFKIRGPNGNHRCLVIDFIGPSLYCVKMKSPHPSIPFRKVAAQKLVESVASLHAAGICHGDLTDFNVLFQIEGIHDWTEEEIYQYLGPIKMERCAGQDGAPVPEFGPRYLIEPLNYTDFDWAKLSSNLLLVDFGEAFFIDKPPEKLGSPPMYAAPERLFGYSPSYAVDLWALGCLLYEVITYEWLLPVFFNLDVEALSIAMDTIGALPKKWRHLFYDKTFDLEDKPGEPMHWFDYSRERRRCFDNLIKERLPNLSSKEQTALIHLLNQALVFEPSHRLPAMEIAKHAWFTDI